MKWYEKQKKMYEQNQEDQAQIVNPEKKEVQSGNDEAAHAELLSAVQESLSCQNTKQAPEEQPAVVEKATKSKVTTIIQEHTTLQGDMDTDDDITIHGVFIGNISCGGDLTISGSVKGNITCINAVLQQAKIEGDILCDTHLNISQGTSVHGNVNAKDVICGGQIIGDTCVEGKSQFLASSTISGDIQTQCLEVECGAVLQGNLQVHSKS